MISLLAILSMLIDHIAIVFFPKFIMLKIIGRISFPLFAWGIAKGYRYTRNYYKYLVRIFILALVSQIPYYLLFNTTRLNICFTLLLGLITLKVYDLNNKYLKSPLILLSIAAAHLFNFDYDAYGILTILLFHIYWNKESIIYYQALLTLLSIIIFKFDAIQLFAIFAPMLILFLCNKDFKINKFIQYSFYPAHLLILYLIKKGGLL